MSRCSAFVRAAILAIELGMPAVYPSLAMEEPGAEQVEEVPATVANAPGVAWGWQPFRYALHLAAAYGIAVFVTPYFAGWTGGTLLPLLGHAPVNRHFEFFFSHLLAFSFIPAFVAGFVNARFRHAVAEFVWVVPCAILAYRIAIYAHTSSVLYSSSGIPQGFYHYFDSEFSIPSYSDYKEMFQSFSGNPDVFRGLDQLHYTAPFYASL